MKKLLKLFGMVAVLTALPVAFTGGANDGTLGVGVNKLCAQDDDDGDDGPCAFQIGSVCRNGSEEIFNHRRMAN